MSENKIFNDTERRAASLRQLSFLISVGLSPSLLCNVNGAPACINEAAAAWRTPVGVVGRVSTGTILITAKYRSGAILIQIKSNQYIDVSGLFAHRATLSPTALLHAAVIRSIHLLTGVLWSTRVHRFADPATSETWQKFKW